MMDWMFQITPLLYMRISRLYSVACFFSNSPKRQLALESWLDSVFADEKRNKLKAMCRTRWVERHQAFEVFVDIFLLIVTCSKGIASATSLSGIAIPAMIQPHIY